MVAGALLHDIPTTAEMLGIGRTQVYEEIKSGRLSTVRIGRRSLIKHAELERYVNELQPAA